MRRSQKVSKIEIAFSLVLIIAIAVGFGIGWRNVILAIFDPITPTAIFAGAIGLIVWKLATKFCSR